MGQPGGLPLRNWAAGVVAAARDPLVVQDEAVVLDRRPHVEVVLAPPPALALDGIDGAQDSRALVVELESVLE